jgi:penicillin amidase
MSSRITHADLQAALPDVTSTCTCGLQQPVEYAGIPGVFPHPPTTNTTPSSRRWIVTAQDRLWHMDYDRQRAGRWAEWAGRARPEDRLMRTFRLARAARADLSVSSPAAQAMLESYTAGVNAFITTTRALPSSTPFWTPPRSPGKPGTAWRSIKCATCSWAPTR